MVCQCFEREAGILKEGGKGGASMGRREGGGSAGRRGTHSFSELLQVLALLLARGQPLQEAKRTKCGNMDSAPIQGTICPKWLFQHSPTPCPGPFHTA